MPMEWLRAKDLPRQIERQFGDIVSISTVLRLRRRYPLTIPCSSDELRTWWLKARDQERQRLQQSGRQPKQLP